MGCNPTPAQQVGIHPMDNVPPQPKVLSVNSCPAIILRRPGSLVHAHDPKKLNRFSERYLAVLRTHFELGPQADPQASQRLGEQAVTLGLPTLQLAKIHDLALGTLILSGCPIKLRKDMTDRAAAFFQTASAPIEKAHRRTRDASAELNTLNTALTLRTREVKESRRKLQEGIIQRQAAEAALKTSREASVRLLEEARHLQKYLQDMARAMFSARERDRKTMSHVLQEEIAQTLLGIQVRLLALKKEVAVSNEDFKKEIAITQRLVEKSAYTLKHFASKLGHPDEN